MNKRFKYEKQNQQSASPPAPPKKVLFLGFCMQNQGAHKSPIAAHGSQVRIPVVEEKKDGFYPVNTNETKCLSDFLQIWYLFLQCSAYSILL